MSEGQTLTGESLLVRYVNFVKLPHTLFALPFALLGVLAASMQAPVSWRTVGLVVVAFTAARWVAMGFNRIADRDFDARNPRTRDRELPRGAISVSQAWTSVVVAAALFVWAAWSLNPLCFLLSPVALAWVMGYSLSKRFTWWPHLWLGMSRPSRRWAVDRRGRVEQSCLAAAITVAVATWVSGFDIFYALPDVSFDRESGLRSAVVRLGEARAPSSSPSCCTASRFALAFGWGRGSRAVVLCGVAAAALILAYEHQLVRPGDLSRLDAAFFR